MGDGLGEGERLAEIERQEIEQIAPQPGGPGALDAPFLAQAKGEGRIAAAGRRHIGIHRIAGRQLDQEEDADGDDGKDGYRLEQPPADQNQRTMHEAIMVPAGRP